MPAMNGIDAIVETRAEFPAARFAVLTTYDDDVPGLRALRARTTGIPREEHASRGTPSIGFERSTGRRCIPPEIAAGVVEHVADDAFTRESEVLRRAAKGTSNKVIASNVSIWSDSHKRLQRRSCICPAGCVGGIGGQRF